MRQLLLDLATEKPQTLDTFAVGRNEELMHLLRRVSAQAVNNLNDRFIYLWGDSGAGKTHLLHALVAAAKARHIDADAHEDAFHYSPDIPLYLIDDCEKLPPDSQIAAFNLFNQVRENGGVLVTSGTVAPAILPVREDLRTRLGWGLIYQVHGLSDDEKIAALNLAAQARGFALAQGVLPYLITHYRRDMRSLSAMLDALDRYSLETKRPITLPLLRSLLQQDGNLESDNRT
jgi:DnaA family protein